MLLAQKPSRLPRDAPPCPPFPLPCPLLKTEVGLQGVPCSRPTQWIPRQTWFCVVYILGLRVTFHLKEGFLGLEIMETIALVGRQGPKRSVICSLTRPNCCVTLGNVSSLRLGAPVNSGCADRRRCHPLAVHWNPWAFLNLAAWAGPQTIISKCWGFPKSV